MNSFNVLLKHLASESKKNLFLRSFLLLICLIACANSLAQLTWMVIPQHNSGFQSNESSRKLLDYEEAKPQGRPSKVVLTPLFGHVKQKEKESFAQNASPHLANIPQTTLGLLLKGVVVSSDPKMSMAFVSEVSGNGEDKLYMLGDILPGKAELSEVLFDRVILSRRGKLETLFFYRWKDEKNGASGKTMEIRDAVTRIGRGQKWKIDKGFFQSKLSDLPGLAKNLTLSVYREGNVQRGYQLFSSGPNALIRNLGLQSGDVLLEVNGSKLSNAHQGLSIYQDLKNFTEIRLVVSRKGVRKRFVYSIR